VTETVHPVVKLNSFCSRLVFFQKVQQEFDKSEKFFCNVTEGRSKSVPTSVHRLRPGDIDIVGAIGSSLTAGNGAFATNIVQVTIQNRGVSWSIGGRGNWRKFLTLPNILKKYNKKLYGYPTVGSSLGYQMESKFNVAEPGAITNHAITQAKNLLLRMRSDPNVNMKQQWKIISVMIGSNDICHEVCHDENQDKFVEKARRDMIKTLRIFREHSPRTLLIVVLPVGELNRILSADPVSQNLV